MENDQPGRASATVLFDQTTAEAVTKRAGERGLSVEEWLRETTLKRLLFEDLIAEFSVRLALRDRNVNGGVRNGEFVADLLARLLEIEGVEPGDIRSLRQRLEDTFYSVARDAVRLLREAA